MHSAIIQSQHTKTYTAKPADIHSEILIITILYSNTGQFHSGLVINGVKLRYEHWHSMGDGVTT